MAVLMRGRYRTLSHANTRASAWLRMPPVDEGLPAEPPCSKTRGGGGSMASSDTAPRMASSLWRAGAGQKNKYAIDPMSETDYL
jgi:hypothetical protein